MREAYKEGKQTQRKQVPPRNLNNAFLSVELNNETAINSQSSLFDACKR